MTQEILTQSRLKELLHYNPDTGIFTRKVARQCYVVGSIAGAVSHRGYIKIGVDKKPYYAHRLAFLYVEGEFPPYHVDHINRASSDNRWCNLRHCTPHENGQNRHNNAMFVGVFFDKQSKRWRAVTPMINNSKRQFLGSFKTHIAACYARWAYDVL